MNRVIFIAAASMISLGSCSVYRTFEAPEVQTENIAGVDVKLQDTSADVPSWRALFVDQQLQALIEKGLESNSDLQIVRLNIEQAEAALTASKLSYLPSLGIAAEGGVSKFNGSTTQTYHLPLVTQWELDLFGRIRNSKEQAKSTLLQSEAYEQMVQTQLVASIANGYYTLVMLDDQLNIVRQTIANLKENLDVIIELKKAGMQSEAAVNQATANYFSVQTSEQDLQKQIKIVENSIALLINETPHAIRRGTYNESAPLNIDLEDKISLTALANRPDVKVAEYNLRRDFYGVNVARAAFYPSISLGGSAGWTNNVGVVVNPGELLLSAIGSLTQPIFNKGVNRANLKIAHAQYDQSLISFEKALLVAGNEVNDALTECQSSAAKRILRKHQITANEQAVANSIELMKHSSATYLEVLFAQNALLQSQLEDVSDWFEGVRGNINLYKSLSGGAN
jgi:NodT family efflux transporter outer membrane factor (OMF) lipoprotein